MTDRLTSMFLIGDGIMILPFLNRSQYITLQQLSKDIQMVAQKQQHLIRFYGMDIPKQIHTIHHLFHQNYDCIKKDLIAKKDIIIDCPYTKILPDGSFEDCLHRSTIENRCWNQLSLMEIAYLLQDEKAIALLKQYKRSIAHRIRPYSTEYGYKSFRLLQEYHEPAIKEQMLKDVPECYKKEIENK
jgi:hypothetical protein